MPEWIRPEIISATSVLLGTIFGGVISIVVVFINRRFDDRRHLREIAVKTAYRHWEKQIEMVKRYADTTGKTPSALPLEGFIVHMLLLSEMLSRGKITEENVVGELSAIRRVSDAVFDAAPDAKAGQPKSPG